MEDKEKEIIKHLVCDLKHLSDLNYAIQNNKSYTKIMNQKTIKFLEKIENYLENILSDLESRYLLLNNDSDLLDLYEYKKKKEYIQDIIKRLES